MAHYAELDENNIVLRVIVGIDETVEHGEAIYFAETGKVWRRTSYNTYGGVHKEGGTPFRKNYAGVGFTYDESRDAFIPPRPSYPSWSLNEDTCLWEAPTPMPTDGFHYEWDEANQVWEQMTE
jgi:hypothetical protein